MTNVERFWLHILAARTHYFAKRYQLAQKRARQACLFAEDFCVVSGVFGDSNRTWLERRLFANNVYLITSIEARKQEH